MLGILCGLEQEAVLARKVPNAIVACAAARPGKARALAKELVEQGATRLLSFGVAGALDPDLKIGDVIIGNKIVSTKGEWACDRDWYASLLKKNHAAHEASVFGSEMLVPTAEEKRTLYLTSHCSIVDMESQCAAEVAAEKRLPLAVVRAVCDTAYMHVPPVVMAAISEDGSVDVSRAIWHLLKRPRQIPDLIHVTRGIDAAIRALKRVETAL